MQQHPEQQRASDTSTHERWDKTEGGKHGHGVLEGRRGGGREQGCGGPRGGAAGLGMELQSAGKGCTDGLQLIAQPFIRAEGGS